MNGTAAIYWMVRAGEGGFLFDDFKSQSIVAIGWEEMDDMSGMLSRADFQKAAAEAYPSVSAGTLGSYEYVPGGTNGYPNRRRMHWRGTVHRDSLTVSARGSLGAISTLFQLPLEVGQELEQRAGQPASTVAPQPLMPPEVAAIQVSEQYKDIQNQALEFIKDRVNALDWSDMQELVAGLLRAMGYKTRISPSGSDRGKDIVASRDGLGFEDPRIVVEVKHRAAAMGSQEIRSFLGGPHERDKGLYVSTGGFTKDARYEAERGRIPVTLMDLDDLVKALLEHYEQADSQTQRLVPLRKLYWPA